MGIRWGSFVFRLGSALVVCALVGGCGFRDGLDTEAFELVSLVLDQPSYVQGESGFATATIRNLGPSPSAPPSVTLIGDGSADGFTVQEPLVPDEIGPGETALIKWNYTAGETAEPGSGRVWLKLVDESGTIESEPVPFDLFRAATLVVTELAYINPPGFGALPADPASFACAGGRDAFVEATVHNAGVSTANLSFAGLLVQKSIGSTEGLFHQDALDPNPPSLAGGTTATFRFRLEADSIAETGSDYWLVFTATFTDAVTGNTRPAPTQDEPLDLPFTVHRPGLTLDVLEAVTTLSAASAPFTVTVKILNSGTVPIQINAVPLEMAITVATTNNYVIGSSLPSLPFVVNPADLVPVDLAVAVDTSMSLVLGDTIVQGHATGTDSTCETSLFANSENNGSEGSWVVE